MVISSPALMGCVARTSAACDFENHVNVALLAHEWLILEMFSKTNVCRCWAPDSSSGMWRWTGCSRGGCRNLRARERERARAHERRRVGGESEEGRSAVTAQQRLVRCGQGRRKGGGSGNTGWVGTATLRVRERCARASASYTKPLAFTARSTSFSPDDSLDS